MPMIRKPSVPFSASLRLPKVFGRMGSSSPLAKRRCQVHNAPLFGAGAQPGRMALHIAGRPLGEKYAAQERITLTRSLFTKIVPAFVLVTASLAAAAQTEPIGKRVPAINHNTWTSGTPLPTAVEFAMAAAVTGKIYVVGGVTDTAVLADNQVYNPIANTWSTAAALPLTTFDGGIAVVNGILYIFGGSQDGSTCTNAVWAYKPKTNTWSAKAAMQTARCSNYTAVEKNIIFVVGGAVPPSDRLNTVESYNPATNTWTEEAPLLVGKSETSVGLVGTTIVAADGYTASGDTGDNEGYSATANSWKSLASDPTARHEACTGSVGGKLYLAGGSNNSGTSLSLTESFSVTKNKWTTLASMPKAVTGAGNAVNKGVLYCFGGGDRNSQFQGNVFNYVQIYQP